MGYEQVASPVAAAGVKADPNNRLNPFLQSLTGYQQAAQPATAGAKVDPKAVNNKFTYTPEPWSSPQAGLASLRGQDIYNDPSSAAYMPPNQTPGRPTPQMQGWMSPGQQQAQQAQQALQTQQGQSVAQMYQQMLGRAPDAVGRAGWMDQLYRGANLGDVQSGITGSQEYMGKPIDAMYHELLGRGSDPTGRANWLSQLQGGATPESIRQGIMGSQEYQTAHPAQQLAGGGQIQSPFQMGLASLGGN